MGAVLCGCSHGMVTEEMGAKDFKKEGYSHESVKLSKPKRAGNYLVFSIHTERMHWFSQNAIDSIVVITDLYGNLLRDAQGHPIGLFVSSRLNDGFMYASINGMWYAVGQVIHGEYDKDVAKTRANADQQIARINKEARIGAAKVKGPDTIIKNDNSNSTNVKTDANSNSESVADNEGAGDVTVQTGDVTALAKAKGGEGGVGGEASANNAGQSSELYNAPNISTVATGTGSAETGPVSAKNMATSSPVVDSTSSSIASPSLNQTANPVSGAYAEGGLLTNSNYSPSNASAEVKDVKADSKAEADAGADASSIQTNDPPPTENGGGS